MAVVVSLMFAALIVIIGFAIGYVLELLPVCGFAFGFNFLVFALCAAPRQSERFYDITGGLTFIGCVAISAFTSPEMTLRGAVLSVMVVFWALRLSLFLFSRILQDGQDRRFNQIKTQPARFLVAWMFQGLWNFITPLCVFIVNAHSNSENNNILWTDVVGWLIWLLGFGIETVADHQKTVWNRYYKGQFIDTGLWSYSRHPNYFGEILLWIGIAVSGGVVFHGKLWIGAIAPVFVAALITFVSGVPLLEKHAENKWGLQEDYQQYKKEVNLLIIGPRCRSGLLGK
eukprot:c4726_g1_i1.p1 GENE.c4726_g1_i1~~c4726_g1_i1.p1  ORF type:complete len:297 (+),score=32.58 c4726_g1_i1:34-891(+)